MIITPDKENPGLLMLVAGGKKILSLLPSELDIVLYYWYRFPRKESENWVNSPSWGHKP